MNGSPTVLQTEEKSPVKTKPRRFIFVNSTKVWGGEERFVVDLAMALKAAGQEVLICGRGKGEFLRRAKAFNLATSPLYVNFDYDPRPLWKLPNYSGEEIFVGITPRDFKLLRMLAYFRPHSKFFWHLGVCYPVQNWEYRRLLKNEKIGLVVPSNFLKGEIAARFPELENRISVLPNGVAISSVDTVSVREKLAGDYGVSTEKLFLGIFSRLTSGKGHSMLFRALKQVRGKGADFHLWVLGTGEREQFEKEAAELGLKDCVTFAGYQADVTPWMAGVDAVLLPSEKESFPYAVLEAMALGKAALASKVGGLPEMIQHGADGVLLPPKEPQAWAEAIIELAQNPQRREELGGKAKAKVENRFSRERMVANFLKIIDADPAVGRA